MDSCPPPGRVETAVADDEELPRLGNCRGLNTTYLVGEQLSVSIAANGRFRAFSTRRNLRPCLSGARRLKCQSHQSQRSTQTTSITIRSRISTCPSRRATPGSTAIQQIRKRWI